ncbi:late control protein D [Serratia liquefaciens]|uniref:contractile injection system protein, VgrG/Pvc8 family n=1 Tax=Serratia liquefaciens TaxID=614 RepID=UPI0018E4B043|nr:contractile injection system protein, VgrG/Pvc8 family [Serratia liquefaciens]MBI6164771.1 late control protein D [Serratia liquefaciens]
MDTTTPVEYRPEFSVTAEGKDITEAIRDRLVEIALTDHGGATAKADELQITLMSETLKLPSKGARLQFALGFNGNLVNKGWFVVSRVSSSGPPRKVVIYGTAAPMNAEKQPGNVQSQKTRSWDGMTIGDIVKTVAQDNGLKPRVTEKLAGILVDHIDQVRESDASLLTRIARNYSAISKPSGGYWLFLEQAAAAAASGKAMPSVTVMPPMLSSWSYSSGDRGASTGKTSGSDGSKTKSKVGVDYFDEADGKTKTAQIDHDGPDITNPFTQPSKAHADHRVKSRATQANRNEYRMTLTGPCRPQYLPLTAESQVTTSGFGEVEDRDWVIESLTFSLTTKGMTMDFNLVDNIRSTSNKEKKVKKEEKKGIDYF